MPYDVTKGFQLSSLPSFTPVLDVPQAYPYRDVNGNVGSIAKFQEAANFAGHSSLDYEPKEYQYSAGTVAISSGVVTLTGGVWPAWAPGQEFHVNGGIYNVNTRNSDTSLTLYTTTVNAPAATPFLLRDGRFRETDPALGNLAHIANAHEEYASAIAEVAQRARDVGAKIGIYAEFLTHQNARVLDVLDNPSASIRFRGWNRNVAVTAKLKCWGGMSLVDIVNSFGGKLYFPAYAPDGFAASTHNQKRFRRYIRRISAVLRDHGAQPVPLFSPHTLEGFGAWVATGSGNRTPAALLQGMRDDMENDQPGEWGVWAVQRSGGTVNQADSTFISHITA